MDKTKSTNMEAIASFFAEMILKYGDEIFAKIEAEKESESSITPTTVLDNKAVFLIKCANVGKFSLSCILNV